MTPPPRRMQRRPRPPLAGSLSPEQLAQALRSDTVVEFRGEEQFMPHAERDSPAVAEFSQMLPRGVHRAPWVHQPKRPEWLAIDSRHRLIAASVLPWSVLRDEERRTAEVRSIVHELTRILDAFDPVSIP